MTVKPIGPTTYESTNSSDSTFIKAIANAKRSGEDMIFLIPKHARVSVSACYR